MLHNPRDPYATLTVNDHIAKGPKGGMGSQYITTSNFNLAANMAVKRCSMFTIIICALLDQDIDLLDLSSGHPCLTQDSNNTTVTLSEVLLRPRINAGAIFTVPYDVLHSIRDPSLCLFHRYCYWVARAIYSRACQQLWCEFCKVLGHNDDNCPKYDTWIVEEGEIDRYLSLLPLCSICKDYHETSDCPRFEVWSAIESSIGNY